MTDVRTKCNIEIIGAGWGRTGTSSFQKAIEMLGFGPCYHMNENFDNGHAADWIAVADKETGSSVDGILGSRGYKTSTDFPAAVYWRQQIECYPKAKVILTYRDPDSWFKSFKSTLVYMQPDAPECPFGVRVAFAMGLPCARAAEMLNKVITRDCFNNDWSDENILRSYIRHIETVKKICAKERLLVFDVQEGWKPLCDFLGVAVPDAPFPSVNTTADFQAFVNKVNVLGLVATVAGLGIPAFFRQESLTASPAPGRLLARPIYTDMLAAVYEEHAAEGYDAISIQLREKPVARPGCAIVRVFSASINPLDCKIFRGYVTRMGWGMKLPFIPGYDIAGVIDSIGPRPEAPSEEGGALVPAWTIGDAVFSLNFGAKRHDDHWDCLAGGFAEYVEVPLCKLSRKPESVPFDVAAGIGLAGVTAWEAMHDCVKVEKNDRILILGGASTAGLLSIQIAKMRGAWVATTCHSTSADFVKKYTNADRIIFYDKENWDNPEDPALCGLDALIDAVGEPKAFSRMKAAGTVKSDGVYLSLCSFDAGLDPTAHPPLKWAAKFGVSANTQYQNALAEAVGEGRVVVPIFHVFPFTNRGVRSLFEQVEGGKSKGKNILRIASV